MFRRARKSDPYAFFHRHANVRQRHFREAQNDVLSLSLAISRYEHRDECFDGIASDPIIVVSKVSDIAVLDYADMLFRELANYVVAPIVVAGDSHEDQTDVDFTEIAAIFGIR